MEPDVGTWRDPKESPTQGCYRKLLTAIEATFLWCGALAWLQPREKALALHPSPGELAHSNLSLRPSRPTALESTGSHTKRTRELCTDDTVTHGHLSPSGNPTPRTLHNFPPPWLQVSSLYEMGLPTLTLISSLATHTHRPNSAPGPSSSRLPPGAPCPSPEGGN